MSSPTGTADAVDATSSVGPTRRRLGKAAVAVWGCALVAYCVRYGFPFDRANMSLWILSGLLAASVGRPWRRVGRIFLDWLPFILLLYLYDYSRGAADSLGATVQVEGPILWDRVLFLGADPAVWLQQSFYDPRAVHWWDKVAALIYISHFFVVWAIAAVLYQRNRDHWFRWARALVVLSFAGLVTYALMPAAPPWYAAEEGLLPPLDRISTRGLDAMGLSFAESLVDQGRAVTNDVAAIPSLHTAFAVLVAVWFFHRVPQRHRWWAQPLLVAYPVAMLATLVYSGEHYVIDGIIGAAYVVAVLAGLAWWDRWRAGRRELVAGAGAGAVAVAGPPEATEGSPEAGAGPPEAGAGPGEAGAGPGEAGAGPGSPTPAPDSALRDLGQQPRGVLEDRSAHLE